MYSMLQTILEDRLVKDRLERVHQRRSELLSGKRVLCIEDESQFAQFVEQYFTFPSSQRALVGIVGNPASGKTTFSKKIERIARDKSDQPFLFQVSMDGFHHTNEKLESAGLVLEKGAVNTYDVSALRNFIGKFQTMKDTSIFAPIYDRPSHEVVLNSKEIPSSCRVLVLEGIYIGLLKGDWLIVAKALEKLVFLDTDPIICIQRIVRRNLEVGRNLDQVCQKVRNDLSFMLTAMNAGASADLFVRTGLS